MHQSAGSRPDEDSQVVSIKILDVVINSCRDILYKFLSKGLNARLTGVR
jgi:hypothetical protein